MTGYSNAYMQTHPWCRAWNNLNSRVKGLGRNAKSTYVDRGIEVRITKDEFYNWYKENMFPGCSVDRIDPDGHYEPGNIRMLTRSENSRRTRRNHYISAPPEMAWCGVCKEYRPVGAFGVDRRSPNGLRSRCTSCRRKMRDWLPKDPWVEVDVIL